MSFSCLKFGLLCDLYLEDTQQFSKCIKFYVPKGANSAAGAEFFSAPIKSIVTWVDASAE